MNYDGIKEAFLKNKMEFISLKNSEEALEELMGRVAQEESVALGGSMTLESLGIYEALKDQSRKVYWHWRGDSLESIPPTDIYITSSNAITEDGKLVNKDGTGNRVGAMIYGHKKVFVVVGRNKITRDYKSAIERIEKIAAPLNAKRLSRKTPCVETGYCVDCSSEERICNVETVISKNPGATRITVFLIDEDLGY